MRIYYTQSTAGRGNTVPLGWWTVHVQTATAGRFDGNNWYRTEAEAIVAMVDLANELGIVLG